MSFKMPIICKDVYLPYIEGGLTLDQYKEEYGIDLRDYFVFGENDDSIRFKDNRVKLYIVDGNAYPITKIQITEDGENYVVMGYVEFAFDLDNEEGDIYGYKGFKWDYTSKLINMGEY